MPCLVLSHVLSSPALPCLLLSCFVLLVSYRVASRCVVSCLALHVVSHRGKTRQDKTRQDKTRQAKPRQDKPSQAKTSQAKPSQAKPRQAKPRQDKTYTIGENQHDNVLLRPLRLGLRGAAGGSMDNGCETGRTVQSHELQRIQIRRYYAFYTLHVRVVRIEGEWETVVHAVRPGQHTPKTIHLLRMRMYDTKRSVRAM
jgi:hypothetical protein